jgi:photosystem II stability/assembly factor-like uncharacterized protein
MPADNELGALDRWLNQQVTPLPPPDGTFELVTRRARRRKIRKAVVSAASAGAVAAAVAVAIPLSSSLHLTTSPTNAGMAAGARSATSSSGKPTASTSLGTGTANAADSGTPSPATSVSATSSLAAPGSLPADFMPTSVTWDSATTGWVIGPAGTPGHCANANPDICTSIARTDDGGQTWHGLPAPSTTDVTGLAFLNASYGWAFGPELWATDDGGQHWHQVNTGGMSVPQLETMSGRVYALFADCANIDGNPDAECRGYTLMTATAGSDSWAPVSGVPGNLTGGAAESSAATGQADAATLELASATASSPAGTGYLMAPSGTLYVGRLDGTAWTAAGKLPCVLGPGIGGGGQPENLQLTPAGMSSSGAVRLAAVCTVSQPWKTSVYLSNDGGTSWTQETGVASLPSSAQPVSLTSLPDGTLVLATFPRGPGGGIYLLPPGATQWQAAAVTVPPGTTAPSGFEYVGMTTSTQGVAIGIVSDQLVIYMTTDGGKTWQFRPIQS